MLQVRTAHRDKTGSGVGNPMAVSERQMLQARAARRDEAHSGVGDLIAVMEIQGLQVRPAAIRPTTASMISTQEVRVRDLCCW